MSSFDARLLDAVRERPGWWLSVYPEAGEAGGCFVSSSRAPRGAGGGHAADSERAQVEAGRRARGRLRRYCAANRLNRLGTLTYAQSCTDPVQVRYDLGQFFRRLREARGGRSFPYAWVPEWHPGGHGLHAHFAVGFYVPSGLVRASWGHGFVKMKLLSDLPVGSTTLDEARRAGGYLAKYVAKDFGDVTRPRGLHRFDVAQGFPVRKVRVYGGSREQALEAASELIGSGPPVRVWDSREQADWHGPAALWASWSA